MKTFATAAASFAVIAMATLSATTASQAEMKRSARQAPINTLKATGSPTAAPFDNTAHAWTSACYAEFGPNAKYPDAAMLEKCLNY